MTATLPAGLGDLLPAYLTFAVGLAFSFVPVTIAALAQVAPQEAGLASGLINTNQQVGGAIGVAVASTVFISHSKDLLKTGHSLPEALTSGYQWAFWVLIDLVPLLAMAAFHRDAPPAARRPWLLALPAYYLLVSVPLLAAEVTGHRDWVPDTPGL